jgi:hypothetical protein
VSPQTHFQAGLILKALGMSLTRTPPLKYRMVVLSIIGARTKEKAWTESLVKLMMATMMMIIMINGKYNIYLSS